MGGEINQLNEDINELFEREESRAVARALIGGGGGGLYIHIFVLCPTDFF